jgi:peptidoglycan/LPS O-acetylase OafA/YrhL
MLVLAIMGFKLWLLLPVWLSGVALFYLQARHNMSRGVARAGFITSLLLLAWYNVSNSEAYLRDVGIAIWPFRSLTLGSAERFLADYVVAILVVVNFWCACFAGLTGLIKHGNKIRAVASYTFTLYLAHMLVLAIWMKFYAHDAMSLVDVLAATLAIVAATRALGELTEHRKEKFRRPVDWLVTRFSAPKGVHDIPTDSVAQEKQA